MIVVIPAHGANHAEIVGFLRDVGKEFGDLGAALPARFRFPRRTQHFTIAICGLTVALEFGEFRFGVEGIHMRHAAAQVNKDDAFRRAREMRSFGSQR